MFKDTSNLPLQLNSFVGRESELVQIAQLQETGARLVTVVGPGGIGKTRLVTEYARRQQAKGKEVVFVDLTRQESVSGSLAESVNMSSQEVTAVLGVLGTRAESGLLLVVDNLEHLIDDAASMIPSLLAFPGIQIVATSRESLRLAGEQVVRLGSLSEDEALALFEVRAQAIVPEFDSTTGRTAILEVLDRVDRLPLAIELAASRINVLPPAGLAERLTKRMSALKSRERDRPERHRTVAAMARWSWELLSVAEQMVLQQLAVFQGGFRLADAERVVRLPTGNAVDVVEELVERSMIERVDGETFRLFQTIYGMAEAELKAGSGFEGAKQRHREHFTSLVLESPRHKRPGFRKVLPDLRLAAERSDGEEHIACLAAIASILAEIGGVRAMLPEIVEAADATTSQEAAGELEYAAAIGFLEEPDLLQAIHFSERAVESSIATENEELRSLALIAQGLGKFGNGETTEALSLLELALASARSAKSIQGEIKARSNLGIVLASVGRDPEAQEHVGFALERARSAGGEKVLAHFLVNVGVWHTEGYRWAEAIQALTESLEIQKSLGDYQQEARALLYLAHSQAALGAIEEAHGLYKRSSHTARDKGQLGCRLEALVGLGGLRNTPADRAYLVKAADLASTAMAYQEELMARSMLMLFDIHFAAYPMARHQARRLSKESELPKSWRKVCEVLGTTVAGWSGESAETIVLSQNAWIDTLVSACNEMLASAQGSGELEHVTAARKYLDELDTLSPDLSLANWPALHVSSVLRVMIDSRFGDIGANVLRLHPEGRFFAPPGGEVVDFSRRGALRGVLVGLAKFREESPGKAVTLEGVLEMGWPGEIVTHEAGASRVYTAIRTLRSVGLGDVLQTSDEGYFFAPDVGVAWDADLRR